MCSKNVKTREKKQKICFCLVILAFEENQIIKRPIHLLYQSGIECYTSSHENVVRSNIIYDAL